MIQLSAKITTRDSYQEEISRLKYQLSIKYFQTSRMFPEMPGCLAEGTGRVQFKTKKNLIKHKKDRHNWPEPQQNAIILLKQTVIKQVTACRMLWMTTLKCQISASKTWLPELFFCETKIIMIFMKIFFIPWPDLPSRPSWKTSQHFAFHLGGWSRRRRRRRWKQSKNSWEREN